ETPSGGASVGQALRERNAEAEHKVCVHGQRDRVRGWLEDLLGTPAEEAAGRRKGHAWSERRDQKGDAPSDGGPVQGEEREKGDARVSEHERSESEACPRRVCEGLVEPDGDRVRDRKCGEKSDQGERGEAAADSN